MEQKKRMAFPRKGPIPQPGTQPNIATWRNYLRNYFQLSQWEMEIATIKMLSYYEVGIADTYMTFYDTGYCGSGNGIAHVELDEVFVELDFFSPQGVVFELTFSPDVEPHVERAESKTHTASFR